MRRGASALCAAILVGAAAYYPFAKIRKGAELEYGAGGYDIYAYFYPNIRYALDSLARGAGVLWNPYQDCGQPFFGFSITGLLYPVNWIFALLPREAALLTSMTLNLGIAGLGAWWLGREMGLSRAAALAAGLAFAYSVSAILLAAWSPMHIGPYAWMPVALAAVERLLRAPSARRGALLGLVLTLQLLPGFPQTSFFTYQVIALRVVWEFITRRVQRPVALIGWLGMGLALPPLLAAVQFLPSLEVARDSVRMLPLRPGELGKGIALAGVRTGIGQNMFLQGALTASALAVAGIGLARRETRRLTMLYLVIALLSLLVSLGDTTPVWTLYQRLPGGSAFRGPERFLWITSFGLAMACGLGVEAATRRGTWRSHVGVAIALVAGIALFSALPPHDIVEREIWFLAIVVGAMVAAAVSPRLATPAALAMGVAIAGNTVYAAGPFLNHRIGDLYGGKAQVLTDVRDRLTPQDRVLLLGAQNGLVADFAMTHKVASLYRLPSIYDYEPQASLTYAQYFTFMRTGSPLTNVYDWYRPISPILSRTLRRPLFDLTAARYVIADASVDTTALALGQSAPEILRDGPIRVYENERALPRAFFVPAMARVPEDAVLPMLADGRVDPRAMALVGVRDGSAWTGSGSGNGTGTATIVRNDPQTVAIEVEASASGFLFLADQYAPGWTATVGGTPAEILRANYTFRLVAVPAGRSEVVFRYRPRSLWIGGLISLFTALAVVLLCWRDRGASVASGDVAVPPDSALQ
jgi:hypothetical protein